MRNSQHLTELSEALCFNYAANRNTADEPFRVLYVHGDSRQALCSPVRSLPLSLHLLGPMGEATVASHVLILANDKVAATTLMNYAKGESNSTLSYVNLTLVGGRSSAGVVKGSGIQLHGV